MIRESNIDNVSNISKTVGLGPCKQTDNESKIVGLLGSKGSFLGLGLASPCFFEAGESSTNGLNVLETSHPSCLANTSLSRSETTEPKKLESSRDLPTTAMMLETSSEVISTMGSSVAATKVAGEGGQLSPDRFASTLTVPIGLE